MLNKSISLEKYIFSKSIDDFATNSDDEEDDDEDDDDKSNI